ncbi:sigma-70 family RNA polymerase sigma factor [Planctomycetota bacterium]
MKADIELLQDYLQNYSRPAINELFGRHYPSVYRIMLNLVHNSIEANDLTQQVFLKALENAQQYRSIGSFRNWLITIAVNEARQFKRKKARQPKPDALYDLYQNSIQQESMELQVQRREFEQQLELALEKIPEKFKEPLVLHYYEDLTHAAIAGILQVPTSTIQRRLESAIKRLRRIFNKTGHAALIPLIGEYMPTLSSPAVGTGTGISSLLTKAAIGGGIVNAKLVTVSIIVIVFTLVSWLGYEFILEDNGFEDTFSDNSAISNKDSKPPTTASLPPHHSPGNNNDDPVVSVPDMAESAPLPIPATSKLIFGKVLEKGTENPISNAKVLIYDFEKSIKHIVNTTDQGLFDIPATQNRNGSFHLVISREGYGNTTVNYVQASKESQTFYLSPGGCIQGKVITADGQLPVTSYKIMAVKTLFEDSQPYDANKVLHQQALPNNVATEKSIEVNDSEGEFTITDLTTGKYVLIVIADGFQPFFYNGGGRYYDHHKGVEVKKGAVTSDVTIHLPKTGIICFEVTDAETGEPVYGAEVYAVVKVDRYNFIIQESRQTTNFNGECKIKVGLRTIRRSDSIDSTKVIISKQGYAPWQSSFSGQKNGFVFKVSLGKGGKIQGTVWDSDGNPIKGAAIYIENEMDGALLDQAFTDNKGCYETVALPSASKLIIQYFDKYLYAALTATSVRLKNGEIRTIDFGSPSTSKIFGTITLMGKPCPKSLIVISTEREEIVRMNTNEDGFFRFDHIEPREYELFANIGTDKDSGIYLTRYLTFNKSEQLECNLDFTHLISGTAINADTQKPLPHDKYIEIGARNVNENDPRNITTTRILQDGRFYLYLDQPGIYELINHDNHDYYATDPPPQIDFKTKNVVENIKYLLYPDPLDGSITLHIVDSQNAAPIKTGWSRYSHKTTSGMCRFYDGVIIESKEKDSDVGIGLYKFTIGSEKYVPVSVKIEITSWQKNVDRTVELTKGDSVKVNGVELDSPADKYGLKADDVIYQYGDTKIHNITELKEAAAKITKDMMIDLGIIRNGQEIVISVPGGRLGIKVENFLLNK